MAQLVRQFTSGIYNLILGLFTTGKHLGRHAITIQYPKERWTMPERSRGMVVLLTDHETGQLNCTACLLCMRACPTAAIEIEVEKDEKGKRHLKGFTVDYNICCLCGLCEDACNFAAIKMAPKYEFPEFEKSNLIYDMKRLQEVGLDVPYEKPEKKKPAPKPAAAKPTPDKAAEKPAEQASVAESSPEKPIHAQETPSGSQAHPDDVKDDSAGSAQPEKIDDVPASDSTDADSKKDTIS